MRKIILIGLLGLFQWGLGQSVWTKTFEYEEGNPTFGDLIKTSDNNYVLAGGIITGIFPRDFLLIKLNQSGEILWEKKIQDGGEINSIVEASDGGFFLGGYTYTSEEKRNHLILKLDSEGEEEWRHDLDSAGGNDLITGVVQLSDNSYMAMGRTNQFLNVIALSETGTITWNRQYEEADGWDMVPAWDGGGVIVGERVGEGFSWQIGVDGEVIYTRSFPGGGDLADFVTLEVRWSVGLTLDSAYIATGLKLPDTNNQYNKHDVPLTKFGEDGITEWQSVFGKSWASHDYGKSVVQTTDGGYILVGSTQADNLADPDIWLIKTDSEGNMEWDNTSSEAGSGDNIIEAIDGGYVFTGSGKIFKTDSEGRFEGDIGVVQSSFANQGYSVNQKGRLMTVTYPALKGKTGFSLELFDLKGKTLGTSAFENGRATWSIPQSLSGVIVLKFNLGQESFTDRVLLLP